MTKVQPLPPEQHTAALPPPQFGLRALLWAITLVCVLLSIMVWVGMAWALALLLLVLLIVAHVAGNAIGTRLRSRVKLASDDSSPEPPPSPADHSRWQPPAASRMQAKLPLSWWMLLYPVLGGLTGGAIGGTIISSLYWDHIGWGAIAIASGASAVMGGMAVFLMGSFFDMARRVWRESTRELQRDQEIRPPRKNQESAA